MANEIQQEWVDKYCPTTLKDYVLEPEIKTYFKNMIKSKSMTSMTFAGVQGSGKSTLAKILCKEFDADVLFIKCATEGVIDTLRTKVEPFCNALSMEGKLKIVILDECDSASSTGTNNFQMALRTLIEAAQSDTRFLITCNTVAKIIPPVLSRCPVVKLEFGKKELLIHVKKILDAEKIKYDKASLKAFIEEGFKYYPDCRRIIKYLQMCSCSGTLVVKANAVISNNKDDLMKELVDKTAVESNLLNVRQFYLKSKDALGDMVEAGSLLFNYVIDNEVVKDTKTILKLTDLLYQLNVVVDKEPTFFGMLVAIKEEIMKG